MKKKIILGRMIAVVLALCMITSFVSCGEKDEASSDTAVSDTGGELLSIVNEGSSDYSIVWRASASEEGEKKAGVSLRSYIKEMTGANLDIKTEFGLKNAGEELPDKAIFVGRVDVEGADALWEGFGENDYKVAVKDNDVYIVGGSGTAVYYAMLYFKNTFIDEETKSISIASDFEYVFEGADSREDYLNNPELLLHDWIVKHETPAGMLDFEEKKRSLNTYNGRMMVMSHRGDTEHYAENTLEAVISAIMMGCDICEVDVRLSKDGVLVLFHDESLAVETNFGEVKGKTINGVKLPTSDKISDWTYEQISFLKYNKGGYKIATLEEALKVSKGRVFLMCDMKEGNLADDVWPLFVEHEAWDTLMSHGDMEVTKGFMEESPEGRKPSYRGSVSGGNVGSWPGVYQTYKNASLTNFAVVAGTSGMGSVQEYFETNGKAIKMLKLKMRLMFYDGAGEDRFDVYLEHGVNTVCTDAGLECCMFVAENYFSGQ